jgi:NAD(P)-dependent dehydrogenase (short-subunit alcohol dehydrogenase family)
MVLSISLEQHASNQVGLVFSNAGIGGGSFISDRREEWERTFAVDWWVSITAQAFLQLLMRAATASWSTPAA